VTIPMLDADTLIKTVMAKRWLAAAIVVLGYMTRLVRDDSRFPVTLNKRWHPVFVVLFSQAFFVACAVEQGTPVKSAAVTALVVAFSTMGLFDLVMKALLNGNEPAWMKWLALAVEKQPVIPPPDTLPEVEVPTQAPPPNDPKKTLLPPNH
jgi:hypothetical protein